MQCDSRDDDVVSDVRAFLARCLAGCLRACRRAGIRREHLVVDPGFGFGKTLSHDVALLRSPDGFAALGVPVMVGLWRKSVLGSSPVGRWGSGCPARSPRR